MNGLQVENVVVYKTAFDYMVIVPSQAVVESLQPDMNISQPTLEARGVIVTAKATTITLILFRCFFRKAV